MSQPQRDPRIRPPRYTLRHLGIILAAYVVYGVLLFGTSAIIGNPEHAMVEMHLEPFADLVTGNWRPDLGAWLRDAARPGNTAP